MGLRDVLFGRKKLAEPAADRLFALTTAAITLDTELNLRTAGVGGVCFKPLSAGEWVRAENEIDELLGIAARDSGSEVKRRSDTLGFEWLVVRDRDFEDLVTTIHLVTSELQSRGFGEQLLAATFGFEGGERPVYLIYGYKRGTFWPFIPTGNEQQRDNAEELRLKNELERELPMEPDLTRCLGLFDAPL